MSKISIFIKKYFQKTFIYHILFYTSALYYFISGMDSSTILGMAVMFAMFLGVVGILIISTPFVVGKSTMNIGLSFDFMKSLPFNKSEMLIYSYIIGFLSKFPLIFFLAQFFGDQSFSFSVIFMTSLTISIILSVIVAQFQLNETRKEFQNLNYFWKIVCYLKSFSLLCSAINIGVIGGILFCVFDSSENQAYPPYEIIIVAGLVILYYYFRHKKLIKDYQSSFFSKKIFELKNFISLSSGPLSIILFLGLVSFGGNIERKIAYDAITKAIHSGKIEEVSSALNLSQIDINKETEHGFNPYMVAVHAGDVEILKLLESYGAKPTEKTKSRIHVKDDIGMNVFLMAVDSQKIEMIEYIKQKYPESTRTLTGTGSNALHLAARFCKDSEVLTRLIEMGEWDVNQQNKDGDTPAHIATKGKCFNNVISLHTAKVDFNIANIKGDKPIDFFKSEDSSELKNFIEKNTRKPASLEN